MGRAITSATVGIILLWLAVAGIYIYMQVKEGNAVWLL
jgi:hypothetical protein